MILHWVQEIDQPALIPHIAEASSTKYPYEVLFRSLHKLLMDTASSEYHRVCSVPWFFYLNARECLVNISLLLFFYPTGTFSVMIFLGKKIYFMKFLQVTVIYFCKIF